MAIQNFFTSRDNKLEGNTYVGSLGRLWYNPDTNSIYASDGSTVGGIPVDLATGANILANNITVSTLTSTSGNINLTGNINVSGNISPATDVKVGGIKAGPGANVSNDGTLTIDTTGLPLSFGDFTANTNILTLVNNDQNMILATNGSAEVQLVGNIGFYKTDGFPPNIANRYFQATDDGQIRILVPGDDPVTGAVEIVGSITGNSVSPAVSGVMLHVTGQPNTLASIYSDAVGNNAAFVGRRYNGTADNPTGVLANNVLMRVTAVGRHTGGFQTSGSGTLSFDALENFTPTAQGTELKIYTTAIGSNVRSVVATVNNATGVSATQFNTSGNVTAANFVGNVSGSSILGAVATATNLGVATSILAGQLTIDPANVTKGTASVQTFTLTGLTTNHKILVLPASQLTYGITVSAAWPSAANALSIEFQNVSNGDVDLGSIKIDYFAWV